MEIAEEKMKYKDHKEEIQVNLHKSMDLVISSIKILKLNLWLTVPKGATPVN